jgi:ankyrin repeat protein
MFVTPNIFIHVDKHMHNVYDGNFNDTSTKLKTVIFEKDVIEEIFLDSCLNGQIKISKWLVELGADIRTDNELAFQRSCLNGHIEIAKWLVLLGVDIHANNELAFRWSCENGHFEIAKWLVELGVNIHTINECAFQRSCLNGHIEIAKWLVTLGDIPNELIEKYSNILN